MKSYKREVSIQKRNREGECSLYSCLHNRIWNVLLLDCVMQAIYSNSDFARTFLLHSVAVNQSFTYVRISYVQLATYTCMTGKFLKNVHVWDI